MYKRQTIPSLEDLSPKYSQILTNLLFSEGLVFLYSQFRQVEGIELFTKCLDANGFTKYKEPPMNPKSKNYQEKLQNYQQQQRTQYRLTNLLQKIVMVDYQGGQDMLQDPVQFCGRVKSIEITQTESVVTRLINEGTVLQHAPEFTGLLTTVTSTITKQLLQESNILHTKHNELLELVAQHKTIRIYYVCLLYTSPSPRD